MSLRVPNVAQVDECGVVTELPGTAVGLPGVFLGGLVARLSEVPGLRNYGGRLNEQAAMAVDQSTPSEYDSESEEEYDSVSDDAGEKNNVPHVWSVKLNKFVPIADNCKTEHYGPFKVSRSGNTYCHECKCQLKKCTTCSRFYSSNFKGRRCRACRRNGAL